MLETNSENRSKWEAGPLLVTSGFAGKCWLLGSAIDAPSSVTLIPSDMTLAMLLFIVPLLDL